MDETVPLQFQEAEVHDRAILAEDIATDDFQCFFQKVTFCRLAQVEELAMGIHAVKK